MLNDVEPMLLNELNAKLKSYAVDPLILVLPPWAEIYTTDTERDQTFEHCVAVHASLVDWYRRCGYDLHEVPRLPVGARARHVLQVLANRPRAA